MRAGPVNCGEAQAISACRVAFKLLINPERPAHGGTFRAADGRRAPRLDPRRRGAGAVPVVLHPARPADRPRRQGARAGAARSWRPARATATPWSSARGHRPAQRPALLPPRADGRRLGRLAGERRRGRADQQRQRRASRTSRSRCSRPVPDAHDGATASAPTPAAPGGGAAATASSASSRSTATRRRSTSGSSVRRRRPGACSAGTRRAAGRRVNPGREDERHLLKAARLAVGRGDVIRGLTGGGGGYGDPKASANRERGGHREPRRHCRGGKKALRLRRRDRVRTVQAMPECLETTGARFDAGVGA